MLFRAIATASAVHARNNLRLLGTLRDTRKNLSYSVDTGTKAALTMYERILAIAEAEGDAHAAEIFGWMIKAEQEHAKFYRAVSEDASADKPFSLSVCDVCGYIIDGPPARDMPGLWPAGQQLRPGRLTPAPSVQRGSANS